MNLFLFKQSPFEINDLESRCKRIKACDRIVLMYDACYFIKELDRFSTLIDVSQLSANEAHWHERQIAPEAISLISTAEFTDQCFAAKHILSV
jgi:sulfur transfer complex TusBCD TusB component (DsrH family)